MTSTCKSMHQIVDEPDVQNKILKSKVKYLNDLKSRNANLYEMGISLFLLPGDKLRQGYQNERMEGTFGHYPNVLISTAYPIKVPKYPKK